MKRTSTTPDDLLGSHNDRVRALVESVRAFICDAMPEATERVNPGWHAFTYHHPRSGYVCGVFPQDEQVVLVFEFGVLLPDPEGVLTGNGRQVRSVIIARPGDIRRRALRGLINEALALPTERAERLRLIKAMQDT